MQNDTRWESQLSVEPVNPPHWAWRILTYLEAWARPHLGWPVLIVCTLLALLPTWALGDNRLESLPRVQSGVDWLGPLAVWMVWFVLGWRKPRPLARSPKLHLFLAITLVGLIGLLALSQLLIGWLPSGQSLWQAVTTGSWHALGGQMLEDWRNFVTRAALWWQGVRMGSAAQDDLLFAALAGLVCWLLGALTAALTRRTRQGLLAAAPVLWLLGTILLYSTTERSLMVGGLALGLTLHLLLDQHKLAERWQAQQLDFSGGLFADRLMAALAVIAVLTMLAGFFPNLYIQSLAMHYYEWARPVDQRIEQLGERLFPSLRGIGRWRGVGGVGGLPNDFLLGAGEELGRALVMQVRNDDALGFSDLPPFQGETPPGHYLRGATLSIYDGHGWSNPTSNTRLRQTANARWNPNELKGRKQLVQTINVAFNAPVLYAAPELLEAGLDYEAEVRAPDDLIAVWQNARNYTVISAIPALSAEQLANAPGWDAARPLPAEYASHLQLPATISERTKQLAADLAQGLTTPFAKATAIEQHLRTLTYDLQVPSPPLTVTDVADYFLFDLRRGYCDYYATAFVVLARLNGLPARLATGYAVGSWNPQEQVWTITEAEAHSWPEVYFPEIGWIPFEPTAGRPALARIGLPATAPFMAIGSSTDRPEVVTTARINWNWQMLFWLLPLAGLCWGGFTLLRRWQQGQVDPWLALLRWGQRAGRPLAAGETVLEYGSGLAGHLLERPNNQPDTNRVLAREVTAMSDAVNELRYAPAEEKSPALRRVDEHWGRLREYL